MRLMLRFSILVKKGNKAAADGSMSAAIKALLKQVKPEAAFFHLDDGRRAGTIIFEETDQTKMTAINEPLFAKLNATIDIQPVVNLDELMSSI